MQEQITEKKIIRIVLRYLREYYKNFDRYSDMEISSDLRGAGGIVADGYLAFKKNETEFFTITFEATDYYKRDELRFQRLHSLQRADALACGMTATTGLGIFGYAIKRLDVIGDYFWLSVMVAGLIVLLLSIVSYWLLNPLRRYRYIFAIQQFKAYYADDQWVGYGNDVFNGYEDPFYQELYDQCVYNGFGLVEVDLEERVRLQVAPAVNDPEFLLLRKIVPLFTQNDFAKRIQNRIKNLNWRDKWMQYFKLLPFQEDLNNLRRFQRSVYHQILICLVNILFISIIFYSERQKPSVIYVDENQYPQKMNELSEKLRPYPEPSLEYPETPPDTSEIALFQTNVRPYIEMKDFGMPQSRFNKEDVLVYSPNRFIVYPCQRLYGSLHEKYIVRMGKFASLDLVKNRISNLRRTGISVNGMWAQCFFPDESYYFLYLEDLFATFEEAQQAAKKTQKLLEKSNLKLTISIYKL
jgi:hypothetical protein